MKTPFRMLNDCMEGFRKGEMYLLASKPGAGKTSLALNFAQTMEEQKGTVLYLHLDRSLMSLDHVRDIILSSTADVIFLDYVQLIPQFFDSQNHVLGILKDLAKSKNIAMIVLTQLPKTFSPLQWPGNLATSANFVMVLHRDAGKVTFSVDRDKASLTVAKNSDLHLYDIPLTFSKNSRTFYETV